MSRRASWRGGCGGRGGRGWRRRRGRRRGRGGRRSRGWRRRRSRRRGRGGRRSLRGRRRNRLTDGWCTRRQDQRKRHQDNSCDFHFLAQFGLSTHDSAETSWGTCYTRKAPDTGHGPVPDEIWRGYKKEFRFGKFNATEWVELIRRAGFRYFIAEAKHHEGFHWWDTEQSDFKVTNTPFGRDLLKEQADACHAAGIPFGIYYAQREWNHPDYCPVDTNKVVLVNELETETG